MTSVVDTYAPIDLIRILHLAQVKRRTLAYQLYAACACDIVIESYQHHVRKVHARQRDFEDASRALDLGLQTMCWATEHHHRACQLQDERLT